METTNNLFNAKLDEMSDLIYLNYVYKSNEDKDEYKNNKPKLIKKKKKIYCELMKLTDKLETSLEKRNKERELNELLKVEKILEMIKENIIDKSIVVFLNFTRTINLLLNLIEFYDKRLFELTGLISKGNNAIQRNDDINKFQRDEIYLMIISIRAGGVGISLHDKNNVRPRISITSLSDNDFDITQAFRRIFRLGTKTDVKQYILIIDTPLDIRIFDNFVRKSNNMKLIHDGKLS